jgi:hypothetical protein
MGHLLFLITVNTGLQTNLLERSVPGGRCPRLEIDDPISDIKFVFQTWQAA